MSVATRKKIIQYVQEHGEITTSKAIELCKSNYYCNAGHHVGEVLTTLVKSGDLFREKRGTYKKGSGKKYSPETKDENQQKLF
jgi:hypothetical protein